MARYDEKEEKKPATKATREIDTPIAAPTMTGGLPADAYLTEQEKGAPDPVDPPVDPVKAEVLDIPRTQPYPTADSA